MLYVTLDKSNLSGCVKLWRRRPELHNGSFHAGKFQDVEDYIEIPSMNYTGPAMNVGERKEVVILPFAELDTLCEDYKSLIEQTSRQQSRIGQLSQENDSLRRRIETDEAIKEAEAHAATATEMIANLKECIDASVLRKVIDTELERASEKRRQADAAYFKYQTMVNKGEAPLRQERNLRRFLVARLNEITNYLIDMKVGKAVLEDLPSFIQERQAMIFDYIKQRDIDVSNTEEEDESEDDAEEKEIPTVSIKSLDPTKRYFTIHDDAGNEIEGYETPRSLVVGNVHITENMYHLLECFNEDGHSTKGIVYGAMGAKDGYSMIQIAIRRNVLSKRKDNMVLSPLGRAIKKGLKDGTIQAKL